MNDDLNGKMPTGSNNFGFFGLMNIKWKI
jgi:hypothetical protein